MLQDLCVADPNSAIKMNDFAFKSAAMVNVKDFSSTVLAAAGATNTTMGSLITTANVNKIPGLNTLGVSMSRIDYTAGGLNPSHTHPRATEMVFVLEGSLEVGFITTANKIITKDVVFVFHRGLVHFQKNNGVVSASVIAAFNSQLSGTPSLVATLFAAMTHVLGV